MRDRRHMFLWGLFFLQALCTIYFVGDAVIDMGGADAVAEPQENDTLEYLVAFALALGTGFTGFELRKLMQRDQRLTQQVGIASGAFFEILEKHFEGWKLTTAEREVALLAIKGYSISEIAELRQTREGTIKAQNAAIYRKAGVAGRLQLLSMFIDDLMEAPLVKSSKRGL